MLLAWRVLSVLNVKSCSLEDTTVLFDCMLERHSWSLHDVVIRMSSF